MNNNIKFLEIPNTCPVCGGYTYIKQDNNSRVLICSNNNCKGKILSKLVHFCSRNAMNIDGMSEATLEKFLSLGFIESINPYAIDAFIDIYELKANFYDDIAELAGFGKKSVDNLMNAIEKSKETTLDRFLYSLSIPDIGRTASKAIAKKFAGSFEDFYHSCCMNHFDFESLDGFGNHLACSIQDYLNDNMTMIKELAEYFIFQDFRNDNDYSIDLSGKTFVITGSLEVFKNREEAKELIEKLGGKVSGSVSSKTSYLVNNDIDSTSSKNKKAKSLNIPIITEQNLINMLQ